MVNVDQVNPDENGEFATNIKIGGILGNQDGVYTITANQGESTLYELSVQVMVAGGTVFATDVTESTFENTKVGQDGDASREAGGLEITADAMEGSNVITIFGNTDKVQSVITLRVEAPNGNRIAVDQLSPKTDGSFSNTIITGGDLWSQDGDYMITAQQGDDPRYTASVQVGIIDGRIIPEFGAVAALVLAAAIALIIVASTRSRLGIIMPKY